MKELICIVCPNGCHLQVDEEHDYAVTGNRCQRGAEYGKAEMTHPVRVVTSTVRCSGTIYPRCPVKTDKSIPKELMFDAVRLLDSVSLTAPLPAGAVILKNICGTDANFITCRDL